MNKLTIFAFFVILNCVFATKLNYPRVLLPVFDKISVNFTLEVLERGCFKWTSSSQELIKITPIYDDQSSPDCTYKVIVTPVSTERRRNTANVFGEELSTGEVLRCDIILDVIDNLRVITTTRELYLEEAPETFELSAEDSQGNAFTSLEGIEFSWQIQSQNYRNSDSKVGTSWQQVLRFLKFSESPYHQVPKTVEKFDALGLNGYMVLLEGINTGSAKVTVRIPYEEYSHVPIIEVDIMILANIIIKPLDVHILVGDTIQFQILQLKQGKFEEITLNSQYYLEIKDGNLATMKGNVATGKVIGHTSVILRDRNVGSFESPNTSTPGSSLTISTANKMTVNLLPHYNWVTVEGERHEIAFDLYSPEDKKITLGPNYRIDSSFDENSFYPIGRTQNGTRVSGEAVKVGHSLVSGQYEQLSARAELLIYKAIDLKPVKVVLPYVPNKLKRQKIQFKVTGGDGSFVWSSLNSKLITINQNGLAETNLEALNTVDFTVEDNAISAKLTDIKVAMTKNLKIYKSAEILFLPPIKLEILKYNFETALKDYVHIHIGLYAFVNGTYIPFTNCDHLNFELDFSNDLFVVDKSSPQIDLVFNSCQLISLTAVSLGSTSLKISYTFIDTILQDECNLIVFERLDIVNPEKNEIVLPIGSSRNVIYTNGPQKVYNIEAELQKEISYNKQYVDIVPLENADGTKQYHLYNILCRKVGETSLTLDVFNVLSSEKFLPYKSQFITQLYCVKPRFINLYTTEKLRQSCPLKLKNSLMHVKRADDHLEVGIEILDANHRKLMNISSLELDWKIVNLMEGDDKKFIYEQKTEEELIVGVSVPRRDYLLTKLPEIQDNLKIKAVVSKYDNNILRKYNIKSEYPEFGIQKVSSGPLIKPVIENELNFLSVNSTLLPFDTLSIYLAKDKIERVQIAQGSGFYQTKFSEDDIVNVEISDDAKELIITPIRIGYVKLELIDRCLMTEPSYLHISVVSVGRIDVQAPDRVEKSKSIEAIVKLYDSLDNLLQIDASRLDIYELHEDVFNANILNIKLGSQFNLNIGEIRYDITGLALGETKIVFHSGSAANLISSNAATIQVFSPLRLYPRNATIVVGASVQIYSEGGPQPDSNIVYTVHNENIVSMDSAVVLAIRLGETKITGKCVGVNPTNGQQIVFSQDSIYFYVVPLDIIKIKTPLVRIKSGATMPAAIWGVPNISPMILGTLNSIKVIWTNNQPDVVDIIGTFSEAGIEYNSTDSISVRIKALNPGRAKIQAQIITPSVRKNCFVEVIVFKMLELELPTRIKSDTILVPPKSSIHLKANLPDVTYKMDPTTTSGIVKVASDGLLKSSEINGRDLIIATSLDQTLSIPVEVKNIHYILASLHEPVAKLKYTEHRIPIGMNLILKVTLHDNLGNIFSHNLDDINTLKYKLSRKEMANVHVGENFTIDINLPRETSGMLAISLRDTNGIKYSEDFIKLSVAQSQHIFPTMTIFSVGDIICFDSPLTLSSSHWISSDESIISLDNQKGIGRVIASRSKFGEKVHIIDGQPNQGHIKYEFEIRDADKIEFLKSSDIFNGQTYMGHLLIKNHLQVDKISNLIAKNQTTCMNMIGKFAITFYTCKLNLINYHDSAILNNFKTYPVYHSQSSYYGCEIELLTNINNINEVKYNEINLELEARLLNGVYDTITLKIVPAIIVTPNEILIEQLPQQTITITGLEKILPKIQVTSSDVSIIDIVQILKSDTELQYRVNLLNNFPADEYRDIFVHIYSPLTEQTINVPIRSSVLRKCASKPLFGMSHFFLTVISNIGLMISALVVLAFTIWAIVFCFPRSRPGTTNPQGTFPFKNGTSTTSSPTQISNLYQTRGPSYPLSPYQNISGNSPSNRSGSGGESPVYGDSTLLSPQKRLNRRYL